MWKFFQSLFSGSSKSDSDVSLEGWGEGQGFKSETPAKMQMRSEYDHLVFFQQGSDHNTANLNPETNTRLRYYHCSVYCRSRWERRKVCLLPL